MNREHVCDEKCAETEELLETPLSTRELNETLGWLVATVVDLSAHVVALQEAVARLSEAPKTSNAPTGGYL